MSKEELKSVCYFLLPEDTFTVEPKPPVFMVGTLISDNTRILLLRKNLKKKMKNDYYSASNLDEKLLRVLITIQNAEPRNTKHEIGNAVVNFEGWSTNATVTNEGRLEGSFCSTMVFNLCQRVLSEIEIQVLKKGWILHQFRSL